MLCFLRDLNSWWKIWKIKSLIFIPPFSHIIISLLNDLTFWIHYIIAEWHTNHQNESSRVKGMITTIWQNVKRLMDMHIWSQIHLTNSWLKSSVMTGGHSCGHSILIQWSFCVVLYIEQNFLKPLLKLEPCCFVLHFLEMIIVRHNANAQHVPLILYYL